MNWEEGTYTPVLVTSVWPGVSPPITRPLPALPFYCSRNIHGVGGNVGAGGGGIRRDKHIALLAWSSSETLSHLLGHKFYLSRKKSSPPTPQHVLVWPPATCHKQLPLREEEGPKEVFAAQEGSQDNHEQFSPPFIKCLISQEMEGESS